MLLQWRTRRVAATKQTGELSTANTVYACGKTVATKFSIGRLCVSAGKALHLCGGLDILKIVTKTTLIYSVSCFHFGYLGVLFGGLSPPKHPMTTGLPRDLKHAGHMWPRGRFVRSAIFFGNFETNYHKVLC